MSKTISSDGPLGGAQIDYANRRASVRVKALLRGCIYYLDRSVAADCLIRDISETGAKLELSENVIIPDLIDLFIPKKNETLRASVEWRRGDLIGVSFTNSATQPVTDDIADASPTSVSLAERVQRLEDKTERLEQAIKKLVSQS